MSSVFSPIIPGRVDCPTYQPLLTALLGVDFDFGKISDAAAINLGIFYKLRF